MHKVLRKNAGEEIYVTDGNKNLYKTVIESISKSQAECKIIDKYFNLNEPEIKISLFQSLLKNPARFEFVIEKATELGVYEFNPVITETVINKKRDKSERWQSIALSAMKQSQRCYLPVVNHPVDFSKAIESCKSDLKIIAHEKEIFPPFNEGGRGGFSFKNPASLDERNFISIDGILRFAQDDKSVSVFIGPEGGFTNDEISFAVEHGFKVLNLGKRKYRSETAAIVVMSLLSH